MLSYQEYLSEEPFVKLSPAQLKGINGKTQENRIDILAREISAGNSLTLYTGKETKVGDIPSALASIEQFKKDGKPFKLTDADGNQFSASKLGKTALFGGGGGSGGGTANTAIVESAQCVWIAAMQDLGHQAEIEEFTDSILIKAFSRCHVGKTKIEDILGISDRWKKSSYLSAKHIIAEGFVHKRMTFHRDDTLMKELYKAKNVAFKNTGLKPLNDDKWNPGDIWCSDSGFKVKDLPIDTVKSLNDAILDAYLAKELVGISLKAVSKNAKHTEANVIRPPATDTHKLMSISMTGKSFWSNNSAKVRFDSDQSIMFRSTSRLGGNKAELNGKGARGGGAGWGQITDIVKRVYKKRLPDTNLIKKTALQIAKGDKKSIAKFIDLMSVVCPNDVGDDSVVELMNKEAGWIHSKFAALTVMQYLVKGGPKANMFITGVVNYAGSKTTDSSAYVKIHE